jgi:hypothetical protein
VADVIGPENIYLSMAAGIDAYKQRYAVPPSVESDVAPLQLESQ